MSLINSIRNYIIEEELKINVFKNKVYIANYTNIDHFSDNSFIIRHNKDFINIKGEKLIVTKLVNNEILIEGSIKSVELRWIK